jgi:DMSO/TMAO reductase YedYZ molybdopterin-dependent catalytic subunit
MQADMDRRKNGFGLSPCNRRNFLFSAVKRMTTLYAGWSTIGFASPDLTSGKSLDNDRKLSGVISRQREPDNFEFPFATLNNFLTPNEQFYVRTHFDIPHIDSNRWKLRIEGAVRKPVEISYQDLRAMPSVTLTALLECSGNSRVFLKPPQTSIRWELGGVSNAEWTGVRLSDVLSLAGVEDHVVEVILEGADKGEFHEPDPKTPGTIPYARSLPIGKARRPEVVLAYRMNAQELPPEHGFPVRAVIPGWYGMASVKWLTRIIATERPFDGYFQTFMYTIWERRHGLPTLIPVSDIAVKAEIARPVAREVISTRSTYRVIGAAWAGESDVTKVEFSADGGRSWDTTRLIDHAVPYTWRFWEYEWRTPTQRSNVTLMARATDSSGRTQPMERDEDCRDAMISHVLPVEVHVR